MNKNKKYITIGIALLILLAFLRPCQLSFYLDPVSLVVFDRNDRLLGAHVATDGQWRFSMDGDVPNKVAQSIIVYEDQRFFYHPGIDPIALARAFRQNIQAQKIVSGASTLTMQLARMHFNKERTLWQKMKEALLAIRIEFWHSKKEILQLYAAHAPFGGNVVGLEAASWRYFNKPANNLSWAESATLAALPNAPSLIHLNRNRDSLKQKRDFILNRLFDKKKIDDIELELAMSEPLPLKIFDLPSIAPHLLEKMKKDGLKGRIKSSVAIQAQKRINQIAVNNHRIWSQNHIQNAAVLVVENKSNKILAYVGNVPGTNEEPMVDMITSRRSTGSILKPLLYAAMLDDGMITPKTVIPDIPTVIGGFQPSNYDGSFSGIVPADEVIQRSLNIPAVLMLRDYGIPKFLWKLGKLGFTTFDRTADDYGLSLILGGGEVSLWELCQVYSEMANSLDRNVQTAELSYIGDGTDPIAHLNQKSPFSAISTWQTLEAMKELHRPDGHGEWKRYSNGRQIAWKTGTSFGHRDAWAIGITPEYTVGVWVGNADGEGRDDIIGTTTAGKMLFETMEILPSHSEWWPEPTDATIVSSICTKSGMLATHHCENQILVRLDQNAANSDLCKYHTSIFTDESSQFRVFQMCYEESKMVESKYFDLPPTILKYYRPLHLDHRMVPPTHPNCQESRPELPLMQFVYPHEGDQVVLPLDLNEKKQPLIILLNHKRKDAEIFWYLDDTYLGSTKDMHQMAVYPDAGLHTIHCTDHEGNHKKVTFIVISNRDLALVDNGFL